MAQPATSPLEFSPDLGVLRGPDLPPSGRGLEGPANRALSELTLALDGETETEGSWSTGKTLRFIVLSCGLFWLAATTAYFILH